MINRTILPVLNDVNKPALMTSCSWIVCRLGHVML